MSHQARAASAETRANAATASNRKPGQSIAIQQQSNGLWAAYLRTEGHGYRRVPGKGKSSPELAADAAIAHYAI